MAIKFWFKLWGGTGLAAYVVLLVLLGTAIYQFDSFRNSRLRIDRIEWQKSDNGAGKLHIIGEGLHQQLKTVAIADPTLSNLLEEHSLPDSHILDLALNDHLAVIACDGDQLVIMRLDHNGSMRPIGFLRMPGRIISVHIAEQSVVVGLSKGNGIVLVDISQPEAPILKKHIKSLAIATDMVNLGSFVYIADLQFGLSRIDLSQTTPSLQVIKDLDSAWCIERFGNRLVVGSLDKTLSLFEFDASGNISQLNALTMDDMVRSLAMDSSHLHVALQNGEIEIYQTDNWPALKKMASVFVGGRPSQLISEPTQSMLIVSLVWSGFALVDISDDKHPVLFNRVLWPNNFLEIAIHGKKLFAGGFEGLEVFSLQSMINFRSRHVQMLHHQGLRPVLWNGQLYGYSDRNLHPLSPMEAYSHSISEPSLLVSDDEMLYEYRKTSNGEVTLVAEKAFSENLSDSLVQGEWLYLLHGRKLQIYKYSGLARLQQTSALSLPNYPLKLAKFDQQHLLIADRDGGLTVINMKEFSNPAVVSRLRPFKHWQGRMTVTGLSVNGPQVYLSLGAGGVAVVDLNDLEKPKFQDILLTPGYAKDILYEDGLLFVADLKAGVFLIEVGAKGKLQPIGTFSAPVPARQMAVHGESLVVSGSLYAGVIKLPLPRRIEGLRPIDSHNAWLPLPSDMPRVPHQFFFYDETSKTEKYSGPQL